MCPTLLEIDVDIRVVYKMPHGLSAYSRAGQSMSYWNSAWTRFMGTSEQVPPIYKQPERDEHGNLCSINDMMSSLCFNYSPTVQAEINKVLHEMVTNFQISPEAYMDDLLSSHKADWKAATLLIIKIDLIHVAERLTPVHAHCTHEQYKKLVENRANFETNHRAAIHTKVRHIVQELIDATQSQHDRNLFEKRQHDAWVSLKWACAEEIYDCNHRDIEKISRQMPTFAGSCQ